MQLERTSRLLWPCSLAVDVMHLSEIDSPHIVRLQCGKLLLVSPLLEIRERIMSSCIPLLVERTVDTRFLAPALVSWTLADEEGDFGGKYSQDS